MKLDARNIALVDSLTILREHFDSCCYQESLIEVLAGSRRDSMRVQAFAAMSGFGADVADEGDHYKVTIIGISCGC
jgi:hypothetical protein